MCPMLVIMTGEGPGDACPDTDLSDTRGHNKVTGIVSSSFVENIQGSF